MGGRYLYENRYCESNTTSALLMEIPTWGPFPQRYISLQVLLWEWMLPLLRGTVIISGMVPWLQSADITVEYECWHFEASCPIKSFLALRGASHIYLILAS